MDALAAFCSECSSLASVQLQSDDSTLRLRCLCAMFVGMKDNVVRVQQGITNNTCSVTNRMTQWTNDTVREARALIKSFREEPRQLNFFEKRFLGFCVPADKNDEQNERLDARLNTLLCRAFLIQIAIYCEEATMVVDVMSGSSIHAARQEFLGCSFDLKQRIATSAENSDQVYKQVVFQISEEYQNRQDERTVAGKRAFIRWHKAANDMIKSQLQQKLSEREKAIQAKDEQLKTMSVDLSNLEETNKKLSSQSDANQTASQSHMLEELDSVKKQNAGLKAQMEQQKTTEASFRKDAEQEATALRAQLADVQASEQRARNECSVLKTDVSELKEASDKAKERASVAEKQAGELSAKILTLQESLKTAEEAHHQNGADSEELTILRQQLVEQENKEKESQSSIAKLKKENGDLRDQVNAKQKENITITQSISRKVEESEALKAQMKQKEKTIQTWEQELKTLREQLKVQQAKEVEMLERNVEIEEVCRGLQEQISQKEQDVMELENKFADLEDEMKRAVEEKTESIESLERKLKRLNSSLDSTKKDLQSKKEELEEMQSRG